MKNDNFLISIFSLKERLYFLAELEGLFTYSGFVISLLQVRKVVVLQLDWLLGVISFLIFQSITSSPHLRQCNKLSRDLFVCRQPALFVHMSVQKSSRFRRLQFELQASSPPFCQASPLIEESDIFPLLSKIACLFSFLFAKRSGLLVSWMLHSQMLQ